MKKTLPLSKKIFALRAFNIKSVLLMLALLCFFNSSFAVTPPTISYSSPQTYTVGTTITPLAPTSSGVASPAYNSKPVVLGSGFVFPNTQAKDAAGNVYTLDDDNAEVIKTAPGGSPVIYATVSDRPNCIASDAAGNLFVGLFDERGIEKIPAGGGAHVTLLPGFNIVSIAVDPAGNLFFVEGAAPDNPTGGDVAEFTAGGTGVSITNGSNQPSKVAIDSAGNIYVAGLANQEFKPVGGYYLSSALPFGLNFSTVTGVISGKPTTASAVKTYTVTVYNPTASKGAKITIKVINGAPAISYSSPQTYTAGKAITVLAPTSSDVAAAAYTSTPVIVGSGFNAPKGVATDAVGNVYVADDGNNKIKKIPKAGGVPITLGSGFTNPSGVAVDAAGNIYVADAGHNAVKKIVAGGTTIVTLGSGFSKPYGVAVDVSGNVYVTDNGHNAVKKIPAKGGAPVTLGSGFNAPKGIAVDAAGNVYVADNGHNAIKKIPAGGGNPLTLGSGFAAPTGVAVDAAGNVYVGDSDHNQVKEIPAGLGSLVVLGSGFDSPSGISTDTKGNLYAADWGHNAVKKIKPIGGYYISQALPAGLSFSNATGMIKGTPTTASPATNYMITAYNNSGSSQATLNIKVLATSNASLANFTISGGTLTPAFATATTTYSASVVNASATVMVSPVLSDTSATISVNGEVLSPAVTSVSVPLTTGSNTINIIVTTHDGTASRTYMLTVIRAAVNSKPEIRSTSLALENPADSSKISDDGIVVHKALSPNGDGINDVLVIDGIAAYPDNKLSITNQNGELIFETKGYNNTSNAFDGHPNKTGVIQHPGTYFYSLNYTVNGVNKNKKGFIILKY